MSMKSVKPPLHGEWKVSNAEYHADRECVSHSALDCFRESVPLYYDKYLAVSDEAYAPTEAMNFGSAFHALLLEPDDFDDLVAVAPSVDKRTKAGKQMWEEWKEGCGDKIVINQAQANQLIQMREAVLMHWPSKELLLNRKAKVEHGICWQDEMSGVRCKAKIDMVMPREEGAQRNAQMIVDIKTATSSLPENWQRDAYNFGYHRQVAFYTEGLSKVTGTHPLDIEFRFIVVPKTFPFEVVVYQLDDDFVRLGHKENQLLLNELAQRKMMENWRSRFADGVHGMCRPKWATGGYLDEL